MKLGYFGTSWDILRLIVERFLDLMLDFVLLVGRFWDKLGDFGKSWEILELIIT